MSLVDEVEPHYSPGEVAKMMRVDPKTVTRWCDSGRLACIRTLGGHRRIPESAVRKMMEREAR